MTDITPERVEALASELRNNRYTDYRDALRALSAEVERLKADNAAKDAVIVRMREALGAFAKHAEFYDEIPGVLLVHDDVEIWQQGRTPKNGSPALAINAGELRKAREALALTPAALADCVVVPREPTEKMLSAGCFEVDQIDPNVPGVGRDNGYEVLAKTWRAMLEASRG